jgi:hypothetical protein
MLCGPQSWFGHCGEKRNLWPCRELNSEWKWGFSRTRLKRDMRCANSFGTVTNYSGTRSQQHRFILHLAYGIRYYVVPINSSTVNRNIIAYSSFVTTLAYNDTKIQALSWRYKRVALWFLPVNRVLLEKPIILQLLNEILLHFIDPEGSVPCSQKPVVCPFKSEAVCNISWHSLVWGLQYDYCHPIFQTPSWSTTPCLENISLSHNSTVLRMRGIYVSLRPRKFFPDT